MSATFVIRQDTGVPSGLGDGLAADFDGDGATDLVDLRGGGVFTSYELFLSRGRGEATFGEPQRIATFPSSFSVRRTLTAIDLNDDARPDLVVGIEAILRGVPDTYVLLNSGAGGFGPATLVGAEFQDTADIDGDGRSDLLFGRREFRGRTFPSEIQVQLANGDGTYTPSTIPVTVGTGGGDGAGAFTTQIVARSADFNGDGRDDLVVAVGSRNEVFPLPGGLTVLLADGRGSFTPALSERTYRDPRTVVPTDYVDAFTLGDLNGDGRTDIVYATGGEVRLFPGNGDGSFGFRQDFATTISTRTLTVADLNGDGRDDVIASDGTRISVLLANADGSLGPRTLYETGSPQTLADVNGDGRLDLVGFGSTRDTYTFLINDGTGRFSDPQPVAGAGGSPSVVDLDRDGRQELLAFPGGGYAVFRVVDDPAGTAGDDTVTVIRGAAAYDGQGGSDRVTGNADADTLSGGAGADTILAGSGADRLDGGADADLLLGNRGADTLYGGAGADTLYGGQEADVLFGDAGDDVLSGDLGADRYVFGAGSGADRVLGFDQAGGDRLDLQGQGYGLAASGVGNAVLVLTGGGTIELVGVAPAQVGPGFFA